MADRAIRELEAVCGFVDWNPLHFLDVGEMCLAVSIGYDWLYDRIPEATRKRIREALVTKGFEATRSPVDAWFYTSSYNWNPVCNGGLVFAAVALWDEVPDWPQRIVEKARESCPIALKAYSPEGGYPEGYGYWAYGSTFQVLLSAALEGFFGTDYGLAEHPGFLESAAFMRILARLRREKPTISWTAVPAPPCSPPSSGSPVGRATCRCCGTSGSCCAAPIPPWRKTACCLSC